MEVRCKVPGKLVWAFPENLRVVWSGAHGCECKVCVDALVCMLSSGFEPSSDDEDVCEIDGRVEYALDGRAVM